MTEDEATKAAVTAELAKQGASMAMAMDIPRTWATGAQAAVTPDFTMFIFREQNQFELSGPGLGNSAPEPQIMIRNVASVIMPTAVAREFSQILVDTLARMDADAKE